MKSKLKEIFRREMWVGWKRRKNHINIIPLGDTDIWIFVLELRSSCIYSKRTM